jgi:septum formation protein
VDEGGTDGLSPANAVLALARRKAAAIVAGLPATEPALVIGCDSLLEFDGRAQGKPGSAPDAAALWRRLRNRTGTLHTGHCVIEAGREAEATAADATLVRFGDPTDQEIDAYIATGEPLQVAGAFTLEGFGAAWIDSINGNYGTVMGLSMPVLRRLLGQLGLEIIDLWKTSGHLDA